MVKRVLIIGAGISGLAAGCYACMNGYDVEIHESHTQPGGLCTSWQRAEYTIDGCIHWLTGSRPGNGYYRIWEELGAVQGRGMYDHDVYASMVGRDGRTVHLYADADRLEEHLTSLSPADTAPIAAFCKKIRKLARFPYPIGKPPELMGRWDGLRTLARYLPYLKDLTELGGLSLAEYATRFSDPLLRKAIANVLLDGSLPTVALLMTLAIMNQRTAGYPLGGSLAFARAIERRFLDLGGRIVYRSPVDQIAERQGRVAGVRLADGSQVPADYVIAACDMRATLFTLLDGSRVDPVHRELLETGKTYPPGVLVSFGVDADLSDEISCLGTYHELEQPIQLAGIAQEFFSLHNYSHDPSLAPPHKTVAGCLIPTRWSHWEPLLGDRAAYEAEKARVAESCLQLADRFRPGFAAKVQVTDVATPHTFARYTGNWQGTYMTYMLSGEFQRKYRYIPKVVPGVDGLYLASMWTNPPGGIPGAATAGREVAQLLCHRDRQRFVATTP